MKVRIQDFQSIQDVSLEVQGFTVIVGRSNIGKSAIVRAIEGALSNKEGEDFVRVGSRHAEVDIESPGLTLNWKKGSGHNDYVINGETLESVGRGAPPHIGAAGFRELEVNKTKINVQVASQFSPIFLLDPSKTSGAVAAELISDVGRLSEIQTALRECAKDKRTYESTVRVRQKDMKAVAAELVLYADIDKDKDLVENLKQLRTGVNTLRRDIQVLETLRGAYEDVLASVETLEGVDLIKVPEALGQEDIRKIENLETFKNVAKEQKNVIERLEGVDLIEVREFDAEGDLKRCQTLERFLEHVEQAEKDIAVYDGLEAVQPPPEIDQEDLEELVEYQRIMREYEEVVATIPNIEEDIRDAEKKIEGAEEEVRRILAEAGRCPLCGVDHEICN